MMKFLFCHCEERSDAAIYMDCFAALAMTIKEKEPQ